MLVFHPVATFQVRCTFDVIMSHHSVQVESGDHDSLKSSLDSRTAEVHNHQVSRSTSQVRLQRPALLPGLLPPPTICRVALRTNDDSVPLRIHQRQRKQADPDITRNLSRRMLATIDTPTIRRIRIQPWCDT